MFNEERMRGWGVSMRRLQNEEKSEPDSFRRMSVERGLETGELGYENWDFGVRGFEDRYSEERGS